MGYLETGLEVEAKWSFDQLPVSDGMPEVRSIVDPRSESISCFRHCQSYPEHPCRDIVKIAVKRAILQTPPATRCCGRFEIYEEPV